jgi:hypothetical protein
LPAVRPFESLSVASHAAYRASALGLELQAQKIRAGPKQTQGAARIVYDSVNA